MSMASIVKFKLCSGPPLSLHVWTSARVSHTPLGVSGDGTRGPSPGTWPQCTRRLQRPWRPAPCARGTWPGGRNLCWSRGRARARQGCACSGHGPSDQTKCLDGEYCNMQSRNPKRWTWNCQFYANLLTINLTEWDLLSTPPAQESRPSSINPQPPTTLCAVCSRHLVPAAAEPVDCY